MRRALPIALTLLVTTMALLFPAYGQDSAGKSIAPKTAKERQAGKAYDPQRVNDCKVPADLRGDKPRSAECGEKAKVAAERGEAAATEESQ